MRGRWWGRGAFVALAMLCTLVTAGPQAHAVLSAQRVVDLFPGTTGSDPQSIAALGEWAYFSADAGDDFGRELWRSNGTTHQRIDINPGLPGSVPLELTPAGGNLFFTAKTAGNGREVWVADGLDATRLTDVAPGTEDSVRTLTPTDVGAALTAVGDKVYFQAFTSGQTDTELWVSDGTAGGTTEFYDFNTAAGQGTVISAIRAAGDDAFYVVANNGPALQGGEVWYFNPPSAPTVDEIRDGGDDSTGARVRDIAVANGVAFFRASDDGFEQELWTFDGTTSTQAADTSPGSDDDADQVSVAGGKVFFEALHAGTDYELWMHDPAGTTPNATKLTELPSSVRARGSTAVGDLVFFGADDDLWKTDGTPAGTVIVKEVQVDTGDRLDPVSSGGKLWFISQGKLWVSDGTSGGTFEVVDVTPGAIEGPSPQILTPATDGTVYFRGKSCCSDFELYGAFDKVPSLAIDNVTAPEGDPGDETFFRFTVRLSETSTDTVTVKANTAPWTGTTPAATTPSDYRAVEDKLLTFQPGQRTKKVVVNIREDTVKEPVERFRVRLSRATNAAFADAIGIGAIQNDD